MKSPPQSGTLLIVTSQHEKYHSLKSIIFKPLINHRIILKFQNSGDGTLQLEELVTVLSECLKESGLKLPESDVREMADALYEEALGEVNK